MRAWRQRPVKPANTDAAPSTAQGPSGGKTLEALSEGFLELGSRGSDAGGVRVATCAGGAAGSCPGVQYTRVSKERAQRHAGPTSLQARTVRRGGYAVVDLLCVVIRIPATARVGSPLTLAGVCWRRYRCWCWCWCWRRYRCWCWCTHTLGSLPNAPQHQRTRSWRHEHIPLAVVSQHRRRAAVAALSVDGRRPCCRTRHAAVAAPLYAITAAEAI